MSIIIQHQELRLQYIQGQLNYVNDVLSQHGDHLEQWEAKEYHALKSDYEKQVASLSDTINRARLNN